jgi:hypothetical protein
VFSRYESGRASVDSVRTTSSVSELGTSTGTATSTADSGEYRPQTETQQTDVNLRTVHDDVWR